MKQCPGHGQQSLTGALYDCIYAYNPCNDIPVQILIDFYRLITSLDLGKRNILFDNIYTRLSAIEVIIEDDDLPF